MKVKTLSALAGLGGALIMTGSANASYQGLSIVSSQQVVQGVMRNTYRIYALCSDPNDFITAVSGSPTLGNLVIESRNAGDTGAGSAFFNHIVGGLTSPSVALIMAYPPVAFDTFVTIGVAIADQGSGPGDQTGLSPDFGLLTGNLAGPSISTNNAGWFTAGPVPQGMAGYLGDGDPLLRVLIAQLTVSSTSHVRGTVAISGVNNNPLAGGQSFTVSGQTFNSIPAPGAIALLGLAGLVGSRRRRG
jgi:uncharacterized protein (TIGR03382 family)